MPDKYGFNELGLELACIWCKLRQPRFMLTEAKRKKHARLHAKDRAAAEAKTKEEREKILAGEFLADL